MMTEEFKYTNDTIERFSYVTGYKILVYLELYSIFIKENQPLILEYYTTPNIEPDINSFDFLSRLQQEAIRISNITKMKRERLNRMDDWNLMAMLDEMRLRLDTIENTSKWVRSSKTKNSWRNSSIQSERILGQQETLEQISSEINGEEDSQNNWVRISLENSLFEKDYDTEGGNLIQITKRQLSSPNFYLQSIVDNLIGKKMYGADISRNLNFEDDDLKVLSHVDTVKQSVDILILTRKGDIPEFTRIGVDPKFQTGGTIGAFIYSSFIRQLEEIFETDDSLRNFKVTKISYGNGDLYVEFEVDTMYNLSIAESTKIKLS